MSLTAPEMNEARFHAIVAEFLDAVDAGQRSDWRVLIQQHPDLAELLTSFFSEQEQLAGLAEPIRAFFQSTNGGSTAPRVSKESTLVPGTVVGDCVILRQIGSGGMGVVFEAQQRSLARRVALKVMPWTATLHDTALQRFRLEAQAAAQLHHPHIVPVFEVGSTNGLHYYVMQLIEGRSLAEWLTQLREDASTTDQPAPGTAAFFRTVATFCLQTADGLDYAHQNGVVHRDVKPANLLLDLRNQVWITDFGLAKAEGSELTTTGELVGTLRFMAPERFDGWSDPRSDVYSLGLTLYELLTLQPAFTDEKQQRLIQKILHEDPPRPRKLESHIPIDLETIILKAIAKEPSQRYRNAKELAEDLRLFLADRPIKARRITAAGRTWRWCRRNPAVAALLGSVAALLVVITVGSLLNAQWLAEERDNVRKEHDNVQIEKENVEKERLVARNEESKAKSSAEKALTKEAEAKAVFEFFKDKVLSAARPKGQKGLGYQATIKDAIDAAEPEIAESFKDRPLVEAAIRATMGQTYWFLGENKNAIRQHEQAMALRQANLGYDHPDTLTSMHNVAAAYRQSGRVKDAIPLFEKTLKLRQDKLGPDHDDTVSTLNSLAVSYAAVGRLEEALPLQEQVLKLDMAKYGPDNTYTLTSMSNLGVTYQNVGRMDDAISMLEEVLRRREATDGPDHPKTLTSINNLAAAYRAAGRNHDALPLFEVAYKVQKDTLGPKHPNTLNSMAWLAITYRDLGRPDEALPLFEESLALRKDALGPEHHDTLVSMDNLAIAYRDAGRFREAETLLRDSLAIGEKKQPDAWTTFDAKSLLGHVLLKQEKYADAEPLLLQGYQGMKQREAKIPLTNKLRLVEAIQRLVQLYEANGQQDEAAKWRKELGTAKEKKLKA